MTEEKHNKNEQNSEQVDAGQYLQALRNRGQLPDTMSETMTLKDNYGRMVAKEEIDDHLQSFVESNVKNQDISIEGSSYIENQDTFILGGEFMSKEDISQNDQIPDDFCVKNEEIILVDCPFCKKYHGHAIEPQIVLGGVAEYKSKCSVDFAPESYLIVLRGEGDLLSYQLIHWAREEIEVDSVPLSEQLLPEGVSREEIESVHSRGWDSVEEPFFYGLSLYNK